MLRYLLFLGLLCMCWVTSSAQDREVKALTPYGEVAFSTQLWPGSVTIGVQGSGGVIIKERFSIGAAFGLGARDYQYSVVPIELGYVFMQGNLHARVYFGITTGTYTDVRGSLSGGEIVFRPQFEQRKMKLFLALGVAFDKGAVEQNYRVDPNNITVVAGPRFRLGLGI